MNRHRDSGPGRQYPRWGLLFAALAVPGGLLGCRREHPILVEVIGPSMAPAILGPRFAQACVACRFPLTIDATSSLVPDPIVCQNCGCLQHVTLVRSKVPGDRVQLDKHLLGRSKLQRLDIVVAALSSGPTLKRVVGLPGEHVKISQGEIGINGKPLCKSFDDFLSMKVLVQDDAYRVSNHRGQSLLTASRWQHLPSSNWRLLPQGFAFGSTQPLVQADAVSEPAENTLTFSPAVNYASPLAGRAGSITDAMTYNSSLSRTVRTVCDVLVQVDVTVRSGAISIGWQQNDNKAVLCVPNPGENSALRCVVLGENGLIEHNLPAGVNDTERAEWWFGRLDGRWVVARNGMEIPSQLGTWPANSAVGKGMSPAVAVQLTLEGMPASRLEVHRIRVWRDIDYEPPPGMPGDTWERQLQSGEYLLLGDNSANSHDGRMGPEEGVIEPSQVLGVVPRHPAP